MQNKSEHFICCLVYINKIENIYNIKNEYFHYKKVFKLRETDP